MPPAPVSYTYGLRYELGRADRIGGDSDGEVGRLKDGQHGGHGGGGGGTERGSAWSRGPTVGPRRRALAFPGRGGSERRRRATGGGLVELNAFK